MDIEEDIKILKNLKKYLNLLIYEGTHKIIYNDLGWDEKTIDCINAIEHILAEKEADKKKIKELEDHLKKYYNGELYTAKQLKQIEENQKKYFIPVQKVKDKINEYIEQKLVELTKTGSYTQNEGTPEQERLNGMQKGAKDIKTILLEDKQ